MTQGIRQHVMARFGKLLPKFQAGSITGRDLRAKVIADAVEKLGITVPAASTHYNHALKMARLTDPKAVEGLGRPEDKKGGRKVLNPVTVVNARTGRVIAEGISKGAAEVLVLKAGVLKDGQKRLAIQVPAAAEEVSA